MRCPKCGGYRFDSDGRCMNDRCRHRDPTLKPPPLIPRRWLVGDETPTSYSPLPPRHEKQNQSKSQSSFSVDKPHSQEPTAPIPRPSLSQQPSPLKSPPRSLGLARWIIALVLLCMVVGSVVYFWPKAVLTTSTPTPTPIPTPTSTPTLIPTPTPNQYMVWLDESTYMVGANDRPLLLIDNQAAKNPSWAELYTFLKQDNTDKQIFDKSSFISGDFAEMLQHNAENAGWRAAIAVVHLAPSDCNSQESWWVLNVFDTTDRGLVYIDCVGSEKGTQRPIDMDKTVQVLIGMPYSPYILNPAPYLVWTYASMGLVEKRIVQWPPHNWTPVVTAVLTPKPTRTPTRTLTPTPARTLIPTPTPSLPISNSSRVWVDKHTYISGGDGQPIILVNNSNARNPSWSQLTSFLSTDSTDKMCYRENSFVCADFAEMLHNNAEKAGWRAAYVSIGLTGSGGGHALNAFQTTDLGLVYIDCTGQHCDEPHPINMDASVELKVGSQYVQQCIFPESGWYCTSPSMGVVTEIEVVQW